MVLVDLNLLIHATMTRLPEHSRVKAWLDELLRSDETIGLPWAVLVGFVRITTNFRAMTNPFVLAEALTQVQAWLSLTLLQPTSAHERHFAEQCSAAEATGNLVSDAHLAALAVEHDCELASNDADFGRFPACAGSIRWPRRRPV
ncbi:MAG: PIN domain-containing protein [Verrucomicrobiota bacterium]|nr:PIN domain-containing protein [Verrucomicrobiota bacterium]